MFEFFTTTQAQAVLWCALLVILMLIGYYVVQKFRDHTDHDRLTSNELMTNFREMHSQGDIDDTEYRKLKTVLGKDLQQELQARSNDPDETD